MREVVRHAPGGLRGLHGSVLLETHDGTGDTEGESGNPFHLSQLARLRLPLLSPCAKRGIAMASLQQETFTTADAPGLNVFLIQDIDYLDAHVHLPEQVAALKLAWGLKESRVVFRGSSTGYPPQRPTTEEMAKNPRLHLSMRAEAAPHQPHFSEEPILGLDAGITNVVQVSAEVRAAIVQVSA